ncbi:hypothetical protein [Microbulbifer variabilis]|nr:hypothetical protein [Microbulbifer variabilis]
MSTIKTKEKREAPVKRWMNGRERFGSTEISSGKINAVGMEED